MQAGRAKDCTAVALSDQSRGLAVPRWQERVGLGTAEIWGQAGKGSTARAAQMNGTVEVSAWMGGAGVPVRVFVPSSLVFQGIFIVNEVHHGE